MNQELTQRFAESHRDSQRKRKSGCMSLRGGTTKQSSVIGNLMNRLITTIIFLILFSLNSFSQLKLDVEITGLWNDKGNLRLQLFDSTQKVLNQEIGIIKDKRSSFSFTNLAPGKYAIRYYHDENLNGKMDANLFGKPTEGYGFSNNVVDKFKPPPFEKWIFEVDTDKMIILTATY